MSFDDAYEALTDHDDDARWAYGTGFSDPMAGVPTEVPSDVDRDDLVAYCLMLADDALILSHRLQQWVTRAPELEDELAVANIALDLLGQARLLFTRAGEVEGAGRGEDALAYLRDAGEFRHVALAEGDDADFARLVARLLVFATWRLALLDRLAALRDSGVEVGVSTSGPDQAEAIDRVLELGPFSSVQATWNLLETSATPALQRAHDAGWREVVKD